MKLTVLLLLTGFLAISAEAYSQAQRFNLSLKEARIVDVFNTIEEQSAYYFFFNNDELHDNRKINAQFHDATIDDVLSNILDNTGLGYKIVDRYIVIGPDAKTRAVEQPGRKTVIGKVIDSGGVPLPGVTVAIQGTTHGVITGNDGNYSLTNVPESAVLVFSFVGLKSMEIDVAGKNIIDAVMQEEAIGLEEVVAIGYGTQKRVNLTGSVATITADDIISIPVSSISNAMAGRMPGVFAINSSGLPGSKSPLMIRGQNTPNNKAPIYVIDGVVREKEDFDGLDPNELESITVLKDAASAAVYGARASNGVVLATTKRGTGQKPLFRYSALFGVEQETRRPKTQHAYDRTVYLNNKFAYNGVNPSDTRYYTPDEQEYFKTHDYDRLDITWNDPIIHQHNLSVNGGSENIKYYMSVGFYDQNGSFEKISYRKYNFRSNVDARISDNLTIGLDVDANTNKQGAPYWPYSNSTTTNTAGVSDDDLLRDIYRALTNHPRTEPSYVNGRPNATFYNWNVEEVLKSSGSDVKNRSTLNAKLSATYKLPFVEGLSAGAMFNYRRFYSTRKTIGKEYTLYIHQTSGTNNHIVSEDANVVGTRTRSESLGRGIRKEFGENSRYTLNLQLDYSRTFGKHDVSALLLYEQYEEWGNSLWGQRKNMLTSSVEEMVVGDADSQYKDTNGSSSEIARLGYVGRVNYAFDGRYLFEANFRYDASTKWAPGDRWGFFPSVSAGWRISEENFIKNNPDFRFLNNLKLRASYGVLGNDGGSDVAYYQYLDSYNIDVGGVFGSGTSGIYPGTYPNKNITWEKTATTDIGLDVNLWNGLFSLEFDYFYKRTYDILMDRQRTIPSTFGASLPKENYAELVNKGIDFLVKHDNRIKDVNYYVTGNFSFARNHYTKIDEVANPEDYQIKTGRPMNFLSGYLSDGLARTEADLQGLPRWSGQHEWTLGDIILRDTGDDNAVTSIDQVVLSKYTKVPEIIYGFSVGGSWKGIDLNVFFQGVANRAVVFENRSNTWTEQTVLDIWTYAYSNSSFNPDNPYMTDNLNGKYPRVGGTGSSGANSQSSSFWLLNGNFLRLKNLEVGYTVPSRFMTKIGANSLRVYVSGTNLFVIDKIDIYDPENSGDWGAYQYPMMKSYNVGLNLTF